MSADEQVVIVDATNRVTGSAPRARMRAQRLAHRETELGEPEPGHAAIGTGSRDRDLNANRIADGQDSPNLRGATGRPSGPLAPGN
ncbi:MAG: hypothetical protein ACR2RL_04055 [Gammaproteobacteria bacterium]